ncbi:S24 family peptidase [Yersinia enterocolitica]|uniref:LexA family transcriptional regulator n=1 Tax=Yersinia enterocolitica TaxID=630 RepID=UPI002908FFAA|nr:helix-turn-helix transcriptional regulator [Yersinia enterocolitica]EKN4883329.1 helix-turn-helix transcriptional regulator [Yersinia enterocolitica]EKN5101305.1 helix-turn-helix transcriptional regulator [Yersinia enterocolitica]EKN5935092.1 helix-turn-helix transcriptional regulator [Yersinia enterocolitica]EKN5995699.1 helix-turn-helix transcriptional regulator [Yersinia enterocolitica]
MNTFADRLNKALLEEGLSQEQLAKAVGLTQPAIQKLTSGKAKSSRKILEISEALRVKPEWLGRGEGPMREDGVKPHHPDSTIPPEREWGAVDAWDSKTPLHDDEVEVPFLRDIEFACGDGRVPEEDYNGFKIRFSKATLRRVGANTDGSGVICFPAAGNSMEPVIPDGATVAVDTQNKKIVDGELYAINQDGLKRIKQLYRRPGGKVTIRSFNREENDDEEALESELEIVGFVFWYSVIRYRK